MEDGDDFHEPSSPLWTLLKGYGNLGLFGMCASSKSLLLFVLYGLASFLCGSSHNSLIFMGSVGSLCFCTCSADKSCARKISRKHLVADLLLNEVIVRQKTMETWQS